VSWLKKSKMFFSNDAVQCFWAALLETSLVQLMNRILQNHFSRFGTLMLATLVDNVAECSFWIHLAQDFCTLHKQLHHTFAESSVVFLHSRSSDTRMEDSCMVPFSTQLLF
jgi:hypothetical protein